MDRATILKTKSASGRQPAKSGRANSKVAPEAKLTVKAFKSATSGRRPAAKQALTAGAVSKEDLRARIEKLERANATLRAKNKELRLAHVEAAEQLDELTLRLEAADRRAGRQARAETETAAGRGRGVAIGARRRASTRTEADSSDEERPDVMARSAEPMAV